VPTAHTVLVHDPTLDFEGPRLERAAVRGILRRGPDLLLLRSIEGDYGFPGGGLHPGESAEGALVRELFEETGATGGHRRG
jgi:8-oxo-dGTP pyrophosphatase MutT (NUDIX family)